MLPAAEAFGLGVFPWSPLGRGVLTGQYRNRVPKGSRAATAHFAWFVEPYLSRAAAASSRRWPGRPTGWT